MDAEKNGEPLLPLDSPFPVRLADIAAFLEGATDDRNLEDLLWGLSLVERGTEWEVPKSGADAELPRGYALMKLTLLPGRLSWKPLPNGESVMRLHRRGGSEAPSGVVVKPEAAILAKLRAGGVQGACEVAARRLRSSGFSTIGEFRADGIRRAIDWSTNGVSHERLLASLLFPIPDYAVNHLAALVLRAPSAETLV
jgi:CRISPR-associated protein Csx17